MGLLDGDSNRMLSAADYAGVQPGYAPAGPTNAGPLYDAVTAFLGAMKAAPGAGVQHYYDVMGQPNPLTGGNAQWPGEISNFDKLGTLLQTAGTTSLGGVAGGAEAGALGAGASRVIPGMDRLAALASDNAAAARGEYAAGSPAQSFASIAQRPDPIRAYHGSPYDFDQFDLAKIGTGEGNQAYGHGLYFAGNEAVARSYRDALAGQGSSPIVSEYLTKANGNKPAALDLFDQDVKAGAFATDNSALPADFRSKAIRRAIEDANPGHMYEVALHADPAALLDWHKPLSQQPQALQAITNIPKTAGMDPARLVGAHSDRPGAWFYNQLGGLNDWRNPSAPAASAVLNEAGIPGISYLDGLSRSIGTGTLGQGTRNTVMFDPNRIEILRKFGLLGGALGGGLLGGAQQ